ncbi:Sec1 domain-containing protein 2, variant 3 [Batrachochytrium dendrobatidis]
MDLIEIAHSSWQACSHLFNGAIVYADQPFLSVIKWSLKGGVAQLLNGYGAVSVRDFPLPDQVNSLISKPVKPLLRAQEPETIVLLLSTHLSRNADYISRLLLKHPYRTCHIVSSISESFHAIEVASDESLVGIWTSSTTVSEDREFDISYYATVETRLQDWMQESAQLHKVNTKHRDYIVSVQHQPLSFSLISNDLFLLPVSALFFPRIPAVGESAPLSVSSSPTASSRLSASKADDLKVREFSCALSTLLDSLNIKEDIFVLGSTSQQIGRTIINQSASSHRRQSDKTAALIIVDRTLDLVSPVMHSDNLLDHIWSTLPRQASHILDVSVKPQYLVPLELSTQNNVFDHGPFLSLGHGLDEECLEFISVLLRLGKREGLVAARRRLVDILSHEVSDVTIPKVLGRVTVKQLETLGAQMCSQYGIWSFREGIARYLSASIEAAQDSSKSMYDELIGIEKVLSGSMAETMESSIMVEQLCQLLQKFIDKKKLKSESNTNVASEMITAKDVLMLTLYSYSLLGDSVHIPQAQEASLQDAFFRAMMAVGVFMVYIFYNLLIRSMQTIVFIQKASSGANPKAIRGWVVRVFTQLRQISQIRSELHHFR